MPFPLMPSYGASKAGVHSYTESLRAQLAGTDITVTELVPPAVANAGAEKLNQRAAPRRLLDEVIGLLTQTPTSNEIVAERARPLRWTERDGTLRRPPRAALPVPQHPSRPLRARRSRFGGRGAAVRRPAALVGAGIWQCRWRPPWPPRSAVCLAPLPGLSVPPAFGGRAGFLPQAQCWIGALSSGWPLRVSSGCVRAATRSPRRGGWPVG